MAGIDDAIALQRQAMALVNQLPPDLQRFAPGARGSVDDVVKGVAGLAPGLDLVELADVARQADVIVNQPITQTLHDFTSSYLTKFVSEAVSTALTAALEAAGAGIGTALCPGIGSAAGLVVGAAVNGIIAELTKKNVDPFVERDGTWIPEVEAVLDQWCVKPSDVRRSDGGYDGYWNHDRNLTRTTWDGGPLHGVTTPWTIRRWMGDCLHNMSKTHGPGNGLFSLLGEGINDPRDNAHAGWGGDWWVDYGPTGVLKSPDWQARLMRDLYTAVDRAARRRGSEAAARAQLLTLAVHHVHAARPIATSMNRSVFSGSPRPTIGGGLSISPALVKAIGAAAPAPAASPLAAFAAVWTVARLPEFVAYYLGGGTVGMAPPPRAS